MDDRGILLVVVVVLEVPGADAMCRAIVGFVWYPARIGQMEWFAGGWECESGPSKSLKRQTVSEKKSTNES